MNTKEALELILKDAENIECVVILGLRKNGQQMIQTSDSTAYQKSFVLNFFQAWMLRYFNFEKPMTAKIESPLVSI